MSDRCPLGYLFIRTIQKFNVSIIGCFAVAGFIFSHVMAWFKALLLKVSFPCLYVLGFLFHTFVLSK